LRFAILLPFSAAVDAENGHLSATSFCHAPTLSADAPLSVFFLPEASNIMGRFHQELSWKGSSSASPSLLLAIHKGAKNSTLSITPASLWLVPQQYNYNKPSCSYLSPLYFLAPFAPFALLKA
jgi:hypothetical protein